MTAYAGLLIMEKPSDYYSDLRAILVYPDDYVAPVYEMYDGGVISERVRTAAGRVVGFGQYRTFLERHSGFYAEQRQRTQFDYS
ncbi:MAG: zinc-dependent peptidase [Balneolaceae bacterium]|nr:zinc-dependent peptidase [Balneolaceae bacterium]